MKIPLEWLSQYLKTNKTANEIASGFTSIGLLLDKPVYEYSDGKYQTEILDLEHRMDRSDWLSVLGCARDLAAFLNTKLIYPEIYDKPGKPAKDSTKVKINVECPELVNRFNTRVFQNIKVKPSPDWLKNRLNAYGIPSINNVVDITNYVMVELGQPMHAQDIEKMAVPEIVIRKAKKDEIFTTLLGQTLTLDNDCFVLTQSGKATVLGGIVGGPETAIDENTKNIILDAGNYNQINIRKSSRKYKIANETVLRYDKYLHPKLTEIAINRATKLILDLAGGEYYENEDWYPNPISEKIMKIRYQRLLKIGGIEIDPKFVEQTLKNLEYEIVNEYQDKLEKIWEVKVPFFRTDVEVEDDIVSDILRIYGYENIPNTLMQTAVPIEITPKLYKFTDQLRDILVKIGFHEHITDPLVMADTKADTTTDYRQVILENSQSKLKNALRINMYDNLANLAENYFKHKQNVAGLFEIGKIYAVVQQGLNHKDYRETELTQVVYKDNNLHQSENSLEVRFKLDSLFKNLGITNYSIRKILDHTVIYIATDRVGELDWDSFWLENETLLKHVQSSKRILTNYKEHSYQDISVFVPSKIDFGKIVEKIKSVTDEIEFVETIPQQIPAPKDHSAVVFRMKIDSDQTDEIVKKTRIVMQDEFKAILR